MADYTLAEEALVVKMAGALRGVSLDDMHVSNRVYAYTQAGVCNVAKLVTVARLDHRAVAYERIRRERIVPCT